MAAKRIQVSKDAGATWHTFPGSEGSFSSTGDVIEDTILGQTFNSGMTGLLEWKISTNGIFKGFAGYLAKIKKIGTGSPVTAQAMTLETGKIYYITDTTREVWSRTASLDIKVGGVSQLAQVEWIDYLFGRVKFKDSYTVSGAVTADVTYFPTTQIGRGNSYTLTMQAASKDESYFEGCQANGGYKITSPGLRTVTLQIGGIFVGTTGAAAELAARNELMIEIDAAGNGLSIARGFFRYSETSQSGAVGAVEEETLNFTLSVPDNALLYIPFSWKHREGTTLHMAMQIAIEAWLGEIATYDARYLPNGATGQTPLDGKSGDVIFTDISLSGGLNNMNIFNIEMMGATSYTLV